MDRLEVVREVPKDQAEAKRQKQDAEDARLEMIRVALEEYATRKQGCGGVAMEYTNWRKKRSLRKIIPVPGSLRQVEAGEPTAAWHEPGTWVFRAFCLDHGEERHFSVAGVHSWEVINGDNGVPNG